MKVNVYDFDKTIYDGDSTIDFYKFCLKKNKKIIILLPIQLFYMFLYLIKLKDKKDMKEKFFSFLKYIDNIDKYLVEFWNLNYNKIKGWYIDKNHDKDIIISASPKFLLEIPTNKLKVKKTIATIVDKKTGRFLSANCYGQEKVNRLKKEYSDVIIEEMYTDSLSDKPLLNCAIKGYIVKKNKIINYKNLKDE